MKSKKKKRNSVYVSASDKAGKKSASITVYDVPPDEIVRAIRAHLPAKFPNCFVRTI